MSVSCTRVTSMWIRSSTPSKSLSMVVSTQSSWRIQVAGTVENTGCAWPSTKTGPVTWASAGFAVRASARKARRTSVAPSPRRPSVGRAGLARPVPANGLIPYPLVV